MDMELWSLTKIAEFWQWQGISSVKEARNMYIYFSWTWNSRYDGFETIGQLVGTALSPIILTQVGPLGIYITFLSGLSIALIYVFLAIPNDIPNKKNSTKIFKDFFVTPVIDMFKALFKRRANGLHWLIALQMLAFLLIWFSIQELEMKYLYMLKTFEGFDGVDHSHFSIYTTILNVFGLMVLMPFIIILFAVM